MKIGRWQVKRGVYDSKITEIYDKKDLEIDVLGPVGDKIEKWTIKGAFIKTANFNDLAWSEGEAFTTIDLTLGIDYAVLEY